MQKSNRVQNISDWSLFGNGCAERNVGLGDGESAAAGLVSDLDGVVETRERRAGVQQRQGPEKTVRPPCQNVKAATGGAKKFCVQC